MINPPLYTNSGSDPDLIKRMTQRMQQAEIDSQLLDLLQRSFEKELDQENIIGLSRAERVRLFQEIARSIFAAVLGKIGGPK